MLDGGEQVDAVPLPDDAQLDGAIRRRALQARSPRKKVRRNDPFATPKAPAGAADDGAAALADRVATHDRRRPTRAVLAVALVAAQARVGARGIRGAGSDAPAPTSADPDSGVPRRRRRPRRTGRTAQGRTQRRRPHRQRRRAARDLRRCRRTAAVAADRVARIDSDFTAFMQPNVDESLRSAGAEEAVLPIRAST